MTFLFGTVVGIGVGVIVPLQKYQRESAMLTEAVILSNIGKDMMVHKGTPIRAIERIKQELKVEVRSDTLDNLTVVVLPSHVDLLGMGGRWIANIELDENGKCAIFWLKLQPRGYL